MKKYVQILFYLLIFTNFCTYNQANFYSFAKNYDSDIQILIDDKVYFVNNCNDRFLNLTLLQQKHLNDSPLLKVEQIFKMQKMGFSNEEILKYLYPFLFAKICDIINNEHVQPLNAFFSSVENTGNIILNKSKNGFKVDKNKLIDHVLYSLINNIEKINLEKEVELPKFSNDDMKGYKFLKSEFKTKFSNSTDERKNNIKLALKALDGVVINPQKTLSFNEIVGERNLKRGYKNAKIISKGRFIDAVGGGVCQVSSTLYNAAVLANLDIVEVHPHSLKVGYIEPAFDSMVNSGSSDLKIKNNTDGPIIIATSNVNDECLIRIYGEKNQYEIKRSFEILDAGDAQTSEKGVIVPESRAKATLMVYDNNELIEKRFLREVKYKALYSDS